MTQNKKLKFASANALRSCDNSMTIYNTHTEIHDNANRALPDQMINYKQAKSNHLLTNKKNSHYHKSKITMCSSKNNLNVLLLRSQ